MSYDTTLTTISAALVILTSTLNLACASKTGQELENQPYQQVFKERLVTESIGCHVAFPWDKPPPDECGDPYHTSGGHSGPFPPEEKDLITMIRYAISVDISTAKGVQKVTHLYFPEVKIYRCKRRDYTPSVLTSTLAEGYCVKVTAEYYSCGEQGDHSSP